MPHGNDRLSAFQRRDTADKVMFGFVQGLQFGLPAVSVEKALEAFSSNVMKAPPGSFNVESERKRYQRILEDYYEDQKTPVSDGER